MIWMFLWGCGSAPQPIVGCWDDNGEKNCFLAGGQYKVESERHGEFEGTWSVEGDTLKTTVPPFAEDRFTMELAGDELVLTHAKRAKRTLTRQ